MFITTTFILNKCCSFELYVSYAENQYISMISEGSCDTEDCSDDAENAALSTREQITF